ncbi:MAG TPA: 4-hydroxybenzoate 3-monooxygenase [Acidimicrobiales bacterium]|nr:4-hydroxybenzoate 3-monooxygenase [Acidimicrobiales bacterium]
MRTQVGIIGAGPAGLFLSHLLHLEGVESVVVESKSREYVEGRVRAGVLENDTIELMRATGVGAGHDRDGLVHHGIELRFDGAGHRIPMSELTGGRVISIYGQQSVVRDLADARAAAGGALHYEADDVRLELAETDRPLLRFRLGGAEQVLECDYVAGCDGFHGVSRGSIPEGVLTRYERTYPFAWLGILASVAPSTEELIYGFHERGFVLHSLRSPEVSRLYLQCEPGEDIANWPDERIWEELHRRLATRDGWTLKEGPILEKGITPMRSFVVAPMQHASLFLAGDAAHIVPPTGAKGLNLAVADVLVLSRAIAAAQRGDREPLARYSETCLRRVWRAEHFSWWMTSMLHRFPDSDPFQLELQRSQLAYTVTSRAAATSLAENYVGMPFD